MSVTLVNANANGLFEVELSDGVHSVDVEADTAEEAMSRAATVGYSVKSAERV